MTKRTIYIVEALACGYEEAESRNANVCAYTDPNEAKAHAIKANAVAEEYQERLTTAYDQWQFGGEEKFEESWLALVQCAKDYKNPYDPRAFVADNSEVATYFVRELELYEGETPE